MLLAALHGSSSATSTGRPVSPPLRSEGCGKSPPGPGVPTPACRSALHKFCLPTRKRGKKQCQRCAGQHIVPSDGCTDTTIRGFCRGFTYDPLLQVRRAAKEMMQPCLTHLRDHLFDCAGRAAAACSRPRPSAGVPVAGLHPAPACRLRREQSVPSRDGEMRPRIDAPAVVFMRLTVLARRFVAKTLPLPRGAAGGGRPSRGRRSPAVDARTATQGRCFQLAGAGGGQCLVRTWSLPAPSVATSRKLLVAKILRDER